MEKHRITEFNAKLVLEWFRTRGGIAVWGSLDLSDPGKTWTTPLNSEDGSRKTKPHWSATNEPIQVIHLPEDVVVDTPREVKRFHIAVRQESQGLVLKLTDGSTNRVHKAVAKAGDGAWYEFDYSSQEAVILVPSGESVTLAEWAMKHAVAIPE